MMHLQSFVLIFPIPYSLFLVAVVVAVLRKLVIQVILARVDEFYLTVT